jgi:hypothetical protein
MIRRLFSTLMLWFIFVGICHGQSLALPTDSRSELFNFSWNCFFNTRSGSGHGLHRGGPARSNAMTRQLYNSPEFMAYHVLLSWFEVFHSSRIMSNPELLEEMISLDMLMDIHALVEKGVIKSGRNPQCIGHAVRVLQLVKDQAHLAGDYVSAVDTVLSEDRDRRRIQDKAAHIREGIDELKRLKESMNTTLEEAP